MCITDVSGATQSSSSLRAVRYAASLKIHFVLQPDQTDGLIYPPYIDVTYRYVTSEDLEAEASVKVTTWIPTDGSMWSELHVHRSADQQC